MALSARQKLGVGLIAGAAITAAYGVVALVLPSDPAWLEVSARILTLVLAALGFAVSVKKEPTP